jgi:hypothetical protein
MTPISYHEWQQRVKKQTGYGILPRHFLVSQYGRYADNVRIGRWKADKLLASDWKKQLERWL